ncbi:MAG: thiamine-phosphate kinase [Propionibacteriaceae bacterium]|nr:thiamine-phosphate kinase [Propionibacteriaceae bacterium]
MSQTLSEVGESGLIDHITADLVAGSHQVVGPGDDAAVISVDGSVVLSTDVMNENVHFRTDWSSASDIGHRCVGGALADIEAMGAVPSGVLIALSAPATTAVSWLDGFIEGVREEIEPIHVSLLGGDLSSAAQISIAVTAVGDTRGNPIITRAGARVGDVIAVTGRLGFAAAGLAVLSRGFRSPRVVVNAYRRPQIPYGAGAEAVRHGVHALIDVSDGLAQDLGHIAKKSGVIASLDSQMLIIDETLKAVAHATGQNPMDFMMGGGEDHALVGCFPPGGVPVSWKPIGEVKDCADLDPGVLLDSQPWLGASGWSHF